MRRRIPSILIVPEPATVRCPTCGRVVACDPEQRPASFPFCDPRCRLRDLGAWFDGRHAIPGKGLEDGDEA